MQLLLPLRCLPLGALGALIACAGTPAPDPTGPLQVQSEGLDRDLPTTLAFLQDQPAHVRPPNPDLRPVPGLPDLSARTCGSCHAEVAAEWASSAHATSAGPSYRAESDGHAARWLCEGCHAPLLQQQPLWPRALVEDDPARPLLAPNPIFDPLLRDEGVTCAACHVRDGAVVGPGRGGEAPHPVVVDPELASAASCARCHQAPASGEATPFPCTAETEDEWRNSPQAAAGQTCAGCHMPAVERSAGAGASHRWLGAGIPSERTHPSAAARSGLGVDLRVEGRELAVRLTNAHAGHRLPTTDRGRQVEVEVTFADRSGAPLDHWTRSIGRRTGPPLDPLVQDTRLLPGQTSVHRLPIPARASHATLTVSTWRPERAERRGVITHLRTIDLQQHE